MINVYLISLNQVTGNGWPDDSGMMDPVPGPCYQEDFSFRCIPREWSSLAGSRPRLVDAECELLVAHVSPNARGPWLRARNLETNASGDDNK
jgi:hypothetical protein